MTGPNIKAQHSLQWEPADLARVDAAARAVNESRSEFVRKAALARADGRDVATVGPPELPPNVYVLLREIADVPLALPGSRAARARELLDAAEND